MAAKLPPEIVREVLACQKNQRVFDKYAKIQHKQTRLLVPLADVFNEAQGRIETCVDVAANRWLYALKARKLGSTTYLLSRRLRKALLVPGHQSIVTAHTYDAVTAIFRIVHTMYDNLPSFLRVPTTASSANELVFSHGGLIRVATANSESSRGSTYDDALLTEFASYVDAPRTMAAILGTLAENAEVVLETTAKGLNHAFDLWQEPQGYAKLFLSWRLDPYCRLKTLPAGITLNVVVKDYAKQHGLSQEEANWVAFTLQTKCAGDWQLFNQEEPITPEIAFVTSGSRVFSDLSFPHAQSYPGYLELEQPKQGRVYVLGADSASGSPNGDFCAFAVIDITDMEAPSIAATFYERIQPMAFAQQVHKAAQRYGALAVVESNHTGCVVIEYLVQAGHARVYRTFNPLKVGQEASSTLGFVTGPQTRPVIIGRLHTHLRALTNLDKEPRLQHEINTFVYDDRGHPGHDSGKHDDLLFALGLAFVGVDQSAVIKQSKQWERRPRTLHDQIAWENAHNTTYTPDVGDFADDEWRNRDISPSSLLDVLGG